MFLFPRFYLLIGRTGNGEGNERKERIYALYLKSHGKQRTKIVLRKFGKQMPVFMCTYITMRLREQYLLAISHSFLYFRF